MTPLAIARMGRPSLRAKAALVVDPTAPEIARLAADMARTLEEAGGIGLAAPQLEAGVRMILFQVPGERNGGEAVAATVLVNPVITPLDKETVVGWEACLSVPGLRGAVPRFRRIGYRGLGLDGRVIEREAEGLHAKVVQHEVDHLDGVLYMDRMLDLTLLGFEEEAEHLARAARERFSAPGS